MNEKDPLEELFRKEAEESLSQDKPREVVWQKIESNLHEKTEAPIKNFIQSVWFSAAVFALIAVPYFYFFLENMNNRDNTMNIVKHSVEQIITPNNQNKEIQKDLDNLVLEAPEVVKSDNENIISKKNENLIREKSVEAQMSLESGDIGLTTTTQPILLDVPEDTILIAKTFPKDTPIALSSASSSIDTVLIAANTPVTVNENTMRSKMSVKEVSPLSFQRNRFVIQDKVTRVSFEFIRKNNNRLIFQKEDIKLTLVRDNGHVKILTNANNIKPEILSLIQSNKELIYNYYINFEASKNKS